MLEELYEQVNHCEKCHLSKNRKDGILYYFRGSDKAKIFIIGEAPGETENEVGFPFIGRSGKLLDKILQEVGLSIWKDIYVSNTVKCRPIEYDTGKDRKPFFDEIANCDHFIKDELKNIDPKLIITLGRTSSDWFSNYINHKTYDINIFYEEQKWLPTYHPSYLLRTGLKDKDAFVKILKDTLKAINFETNET